MAGSFNNEQSSRYDEYSIPVEGSDEKGILRLIGGLLVYGMAVGGLVLGYVSPTIEFVSTSVLLVSGTVLSGSGAWHLIKEHLP